MVSAVSGGLAVGGSGTLRMASYEVAGQSILSFATVVHNLKRHFSHKVTKTMVFLQ